MELTKKQEANVSQIASTLKYGGGDLVLEEVLLFIDYLKDIAESHGHTFSNVSSGTNKLSQRILRVLTDRELSIAQVHDKFHKSISVSEIESELTNLVSNGLVSEVNGKRVKKYAKCFSTIHSELCTM